MILQFPEKSTNEWAVTAEFGLPPAIVPHPKLPVQVLDHLGKTGVGALRNGGLLISCAIEASDLVAAATESSVITDMVLAYLSLPEEAIRVVEITPMYLQ